MSGENIQNAMDNLKYRVKSTLDSTELFKFKGSDYFSIFENLVIKRCVFVPLFHKIFDCGNHIPLGVWMNAHLPLIFNIFFL